MASIQTSRSTPPDSHSDSAKAAASWVLPDDLSQSCAPGAASGPGRVAGAAARSGTSATVAPAGSAAARPGDVSGLALEAFGQRRHRPGPEGPGRPAGGRGAHGGPLTGGTGTGWPSRTGMIPFPASRVRVRLRRRDQLAARRAVVALACQLPGQIGNPLQGLDVSRANGIRMPPRSGKTRPDPGRCRSVPGSPGRRPARQAAGRCLAAADPAAAWITACPGQPLARERFWTAFPCGRRRGR